MKNKKLKSKHSKVECILGKKVKNMVAFYKVKWVGLGIEHSTWEPFSKLKSAEHLIFKYEDKLLKESTASSSASMQNEKTISEVRLSPEPRLSENLGMYQKKKDCNSIQFEVSVIIEDFKKWGEITNGDVPKRVIGASKNKESNEIIYHVEWNQNSFGFKPLQSPVNGNLLEKNYRNLIIDFLESKLHFD